VAVQEVRWDEGSNQPADNYTLYHHLGTGFSVHKGIISAVKRVEFVSDRVPCVIRRGRWCGIVLNVQASAEDKSEDTKDNLYKESESVFNHFPKYRMKNLLGDFNENVC